MTNLAIIPARSGSKGLPDKNIKLLCGKPLVAYSIETAIESGLFDRVHVSTDSEEYAAIARQFGADVRFLRSEATATDTASTWEAVLEVLIKYEQLGERFDTVAVLQPTVPLRIAEDIRNAYNVLILKNADSVVSVCENEHSPTLCNFLPTDHCMKGFLNPQKSRRQDFPNFYRLNGAIYVLKVKKLVEHGMISYDKKCFASIMPLERSIDIDTELDFSIAQVLMTMRINE